MRFCLDEDLRVPLRDGWRCNRWGKPRYAGEMGNSSAPSAEAPERRLIGVVGPDGVLKEHERTGVAGVWEESKLAIGAGNSE